MGLKDRENKRGGSVVGSIIGVGTTASQNQNGNQEYITRSYKITTESYQKIKLEAVAEGKKDYQIVQRALDLYFGR